MSPVRIAPVIALTGATLLWSACSRAVPRFAPAAAQPEIAGPQSFAEHVSRQRTLMQQLVRLRQHDPQSPQQVLGVLDCAFGQRVAVDRHIRVRTQDGAPARGAFVTLTTPPSTLTEDTLLADDDGIARARVHEGQTIRVELDGYLPIADVRPVGDTNLVDVTLVPALEVLHGRVVDPSQRPVVGAFVQLEFGHTRMQAWTDSWGQFRVMSAEHAELPRDVSLHVRADGFQFLGEGLAFSIERTAAANSVEVVPHALRELSFDVVDLQGHPILDCEARVAWDAQHPKRFEFPFGEPKRERLADRGDARAHPTIGVSFSGVPPCVPLWLEISRDGRVLANQAIEPLSASYEPPPGAPLFVVVASPPERVRATIFRLVDRDRHAWEHAVSAALVREHGGVEERSALTIDCAWRLRVDEQPEDFTIEVFSPGAPLFRQHFPAHFDSAEIIELVVAER